jgi:hypothetical protein
MTEGDLVRDLSYEGRPPIVRLVMPTEQDGVWTVTPEGTHPRGPYDYRLHECWMLPLSPLEVLIRETENNQE